MGRDILLFKCNDIYLKIALNQGNPYMPLNGMIAKHLINLSIAYLIIYCISDYL